MKTNLKKIILRLFNWMFSSNVELKDIETVRLVADEKLHFMSDQIGTIRLLVAEKLSLEQADIQTLKLLVREKLRIEERDVEFVRCAVGGLNENSVDCLRALCGDGSALTAKLVPELLLQLEKVALLNRLGDIGDISEGTQLSYSQEGEAFILDRYFNFRPEGFYVDVGAHHPKRFSNTYSFYKRGWRGLNIDPTPGVKEMFEAVRPEDISLSVAVSNTEGKQDFYLFSEPALNTFSQGLAEEYQKVGCKLLEVRSIESKRLSSLLEECQIDKPIDFMTIDVEDHELQVLQSNDWDKFRPQVLLVEILNFDMAHSEAYPVHNFILEQGYVLFAKTFNTLFYKDAR